MDDIRNPIGANGFLPANFAFLREKADALAQLSESLFESAIREALPSLSSPPTPEEAADLFSASGGDDFAGFCLCVSRLAEPAPSPALPSDPLSSDEPVRIAYLQNAFSDRAYRVFTASSDAAAAVYFPEFREVCEEVYSGRCTFAILPTSSSTDGQILSFRRLIGRYDLKIAAVTDVPLDEDQSMRFALLRRRLPPPPYRASFLDISAVPTDEMTAGALLAAFERFGAALVSVYSHPSGPEEDRNMLDLTFDLRKADPLALHLFLEGSHVRYETVGSYELL